jgi:hypothetical protein
MKTLQVLFLPLLLLSLAPAAWAQNLFFQGDALSDRTFNSDNGPTNSQLTLDFTNAQPGVLQNILTWGENSGSGGLNGVGESFKLYVLRPTGGNNYQVVFATGYLTVGNVGTNTFAVSGTPFGLQVGDVIAHYGRGIPFSNGTGGPSSVYIAVNLPPPVVETTITVPSSTYPLYNDGGRNYAIQVLALGQPFLVTTNRDNGPGSLRQAALDANAFGSASTINFANTLSGQTITLTNGQIELSNNVTIDGSALANGIQINGNGQSRIFQVDNGGIVTLNSLTITNGNGGYAGGGIYNGSTLTLNNCTVIGNHANAGGQYAGGGIDNDGTLTLNNCTITGNQGNGSGSAGGGGISDQGMLTVNNCTITGNDANNTDLGGGGILIWGGTLNLTNSIVCSNTAFSGNNIRSYFGTYNYGNDLVDTNALLAPLGNYGGPTQTMPPLPGSPAIDTGRVTAFTTDQRGFPRPVGLGPDIGAVEGVYYAAGPGKIKTITRLSNGSVQLGFTNVTDAIFPVLATTNLTQSLSNWTQIGLASESPVGSGQFPFTDTQATNYPQRFYRIGSP